MVRRTRKQRGGLWGDLAQRAASAYVNKVALPVTKYAVKQAVNRSGLANTPEVQAAQAMFRDAQAAYRSPQGQAMMNQFLQAARSPQAQALMAQAKQAATSPQAQAAAAGLFAAAAPQLANPYGRSAAPVPMAQYAPTAPPMAAPAPMVQPVAAAPVMAAPVAMTANPQVDMLVSALIWNEANAPYRASLAKEAGRLAKDVKKSTAWNQSLQDALSALAKDVTTLVKEQGVQPGTQFFRTTTEPQPTQVIESLAMLMDPSFRMAVAQRLATHKRDPQDQRFLPGTVNQLAAAIRTEVQKVAFGGRKTRRARKVRRTTRRR